MEEKSVEATEDGDDHFTLREKKKALAKPPSPIHCRHSKPALQSIRELFQGK